MTLLTQQEIDALSPEEFAKLSWTACPQVDLTPVNLLPSTELLVITNTIEEIYEDWRNSNQFTIQMKYDQPNISGTYQEVLLALKDDTANLRVSLTKVLKKVVNLMSTLNPLTNDAYPFIVVKYKNNYYVKMTTPTEFDSEFVYMKVPAMNVSNSQQAIILASFSLPYDTQYEEYVNHAYDEAYDQQQADEYMY